MSDARAATDAELMASLRDFVGRYRSSGNEPANVMRVMTLLNRLLDDNASDAARIRELEAALAGLVEIHDTMTPLPPGPQGIKEHVTKFHARLDAARTMLAAAPRP